jgi:iron(III) transport system permease protein
MIRRPRFHGWSVAAFFVAALVLVPLVVVLSSLFLKTDPIWQHLAETMLAGLLWNTLWLTLGVAFGTGVLGVSLAWLTAACDFPGRKFFDWALMLPLAVPSYVIAFVAIGILDFTGPIQTALRAWSGREDLSFPKIRSTGGVILVMTLALYPYVYLLARNAFLTQGRRAMEAAQSLGHNRWSSFFRVALPMARPWIAGGILLALMETLADFGTVSIFNYDTFTTAIYKAWFGFFSLSAASQLASLLVLLVFVMILMEQGFTSRMRYTPAERSGAQSDRVRLTPLQGRLAFAYSFFILCIAFVIPVAQLVLWARRVFRQDFDERYLAFLTHSLLLGAIAALLTVFCALILVYAGRLRNTLMTRVTVRIATLGYALPGSVLAVGIFIPLVWLDNQIMLRGKEWFGFETGFVLKGTLITMLLAYLIRFLAVAHNPLHSAIQRVTLNTDEAARSLGVSGIAMLRKVHLPVLRGGFLTAMTLVFVDVLKEMPITLMTRPFGWDTLSVRIFEMTSEGEWERAALPALVLVMAGFFPIMLLTKHGGERQALNQGD